MYIHMEILILYIYILVCTTINTVYSLIILCSNIFIPQTFWSPTIFCFLVYFCFIAARNYYVYSVVYLILVNYGYSHQNTMLVLLFIQRYIYANYYIILQYSILHTYYRYSITTKVNSPILRDGIYLQLVASQLNIIMYIKAKRRLYANKWKSIMVFTIYTVQNCNLAVGIRSKAGISTKLLSTVEQSKRYKCWYTK